MRLEQVGSTLEPDNRKKKKKKTRTRRASTHFFIVLAGTIADNEVGQMLYRDYLPVALESKVFKPTPDPLVTGHGLEAIQAGLDRVREGLSGQKVVVTLGD